jgi:hypothetical protein
MDSSLHISSDSSHSYASQCQVIEQGQTVTENGISLLNMFQISGFCQPSLL